MNRIHLRRLDCCLPLSASLDACSVSKSTVSLARSTADLIPRRVRLHSSAKYDRSVASVLGDTANRGSSNLIGLSSNAGGFTSDANGGGVVETLLQSPSFLYRTELGSSGAPSRVTQLTPYEIASELSHFTTGAPPDAQLMAAADANLYSADPELLRYPQYTGMLPKLSG